ncbi:ABC transporter permease [Nocardia arthritidis]|uniref:ABC transporter permease n=1 Tax=Nocardia arthritidis TaxID=228602 RepID=A0A6G9YQC6_9NOCA|nr:ABC transporter permease [Nocardia arthritidis]QIS15320.1 ABC transporter permease [Nocardia arthritidis]
MIEIIPAELLPAVNSEIRKVTTLRRYQLLAAALVVVAIVAGSGFALMSGNADPKGQPATGAATIGLYLAMAATIVAAGVFGALGAGEEYRYRTMPATVLFTPNRDRIAIAKFAVAAGFAVATAALVEVIGAGCTLGFGRGKFDIGLKFFAALGGGLVAALCWAVLGTALGLLLRSAAGAAAALLGWFIVIEPLIWLITNTLGIPGFATLLPGSATVSTVVVGSFAKSHFLAPAPAAVVVLVLWTSALGVAAWWYLRRREV